MEIVNPVENFLCENKNIVYSIRKLSKELGIKKKQVYYYYTVSNNISKVLPITIGSGKANLNIFKYIE